MKKESGYIFYKKTGRMTVCALGLVGLLLCAGCASKTNGTEVSAPTKAAAPTNTLAPTEAPEPTEAGAETTPTEAPEPTETPVPTEAGAETTPTPTEVPIPTEAGAETTPTEAPEPTGAEPTPVPTEAPAPTGAETTPTEAPEPTETPTLTGTPEPTEAPVPTEAPAPTSTPTPAPTSTPVPTKAPTPQTSAKVGDIVRLGSYEQDNNSSNGKEAIEWIVASVKGEEVLLVSRYVLDSMPYHKDFGTISWEQSSLRKWLNGDFYKDSFTAAEKEQILQKTLENPQNKDYGIKGGNATKDFIFVLSMDEAEGWSANNKDRMAAATKYAQAKGCYLSTQEHCKGYPSWWLRSSGNTNTSAAVVEPDGYVAAYGEYANLDIIGVRPAMWVKLKD